MQVWLRRGRAHGGIDGQGGFLVEEHLAGLYGHVVGGQLRPGLDRADDVELLTGAGGAGNKIDAAGADPQGLEDIKTNLDLFHRIGCQ